MSDEIATWFFDESSSSRIFINSQENDLLDGGDWWEDSARKVEEKFGNSWYCFEIISSNQNSGRILERDYCINSRKPINYFNWMSKIYLFGETSWTNLERTFAGSFIYQVDHQEIQPHRYYRLATDENVISMIKSICGKKLENYPVLDIVINPSPTSLLALKLAEPYKYPIYIPTKNKVQRLQKLQKSLSLSHEFIGSSLTFLRAIEQFELSDLNFISESFDLLETMADEKSLDSLHSRFLNEFSY